GVGTSMAFTAIRASLSKASNRLFLEDPSGSEDTVENQNRIPVGDAITPDHDQDDVRNHRQGQVDEEEETDAGARRHGETKNREQHEQRVEDSGRPHDRALPEEGVRIRTYPVPALAEEESRPAGQIASSLFQSLADKVARLGSRRAAARRVDRPRLTLQIGEHRAAPFLILREALQLVEANHPVGVALIEAAPSGVIDREELPVDQ